VHEAIGHFTQPRGEFTIIVEGKKGGKPELDEGIEDELITLYKQGSSAKDAIAIVSEARGIPKKRLYESWLRIKKGE
jgi:16S rRNA (cytidine1402-2'-O)-methyltransferase